eukprot:Skav229089  [mRNA]  locus=scaffold92:74342:78206:- [translate_table: standard]
MSWSSSESHHWSGGHHFTHKESHHWSSGGAHEVEMPDSKSFVEQVVATGWRSSEGLEVGRGSGQVRSYRGLSTSLPSLQQ